MPVMEAGAVGAQAGEEDVVGGEGGEDVPAGLRCPLPLPRKGEGLAGARGDVRKDTLPPLPLPLPLPPLTGAAEERVARLSFFFVFSRL